MDEQNTPLEAASRELSEQEQIRRTKLQRLVEEGRDPYKLTRYDRTHTSEEIVSGYEALEGKEVSIAGRMVSRRIMGKASFAHLLDGKGDIQFYARRDDVGEEAYAEFKTYDIGDLVGVRGTVFKTKTGEISVHASEITLLCKSLKPLPEKWNGLRDTDLRYRQRYVDMIVNPEVRDTFIKRSLIISMRAASSRWTPPCCTRWKSARTRVPSSPTTTRWTSICTCASRRSST